jgi:hypothetical protein
MTSTSFMIGTGFMKCMPITLSARFVAAPRTVIEIDDVLLARMRPWASLRPAVKMLFLTRAVLGHRFDHQLAVIAGRDVRRARDAPRISSFASAW